MELDSNWPKKASCRDDPDAAFVSGKAQHDFVADKCKGCPVKSECLIDTLTAADPKKVFGVCGGLTTREQKVVLNDPDKLQTALSRAWAVINNRECTAR